MKKLSFKIRRWFERRESRHQASERRRARVLRNRRYLTRIDPRVVRVREENRRERRKIFYEIHKPLKYEKSPKSLVVTGELGLEQEATRNAFLNFAEEVIEFDAKELVIDLSKVDRVWPSAVTLLCSMKQWLEAGAAIGVSKHPSIRSTDPDCQYVASYLDHCGFHKYVGRGMASGEVSFPGEEIVKIVRERNRRKLKSRELRIRNLVEKCSRMDVEDIEWFDSIILSESFQNIVEHGTGYKDQGWWILGQRHKRHGFISICLADNGIGIKNSLLYGPQCDDLASMGLTATTGDGAFIRAALMQNVSGAHDASEKSGFLKKQYPLGARRGKGLERIREKAKDLKIEWAILSHYGYAFLNRDGIISEQGTRKRRIFGGTMYWFKIDDRENENY